MFKRNRIIFASLALLASGALPLAAFAQAQTNPNQPVLSGPKQAGKTQPGQLQQAGQAQQPGQVQQNQRQPYQANMPAINEQGRLGQNGKQDVDLFVIPCLINANNGEVTLANIATQKAQSNEVKEFAQQMIKDHSASAKQFEQLQANMKQQLRPQSPNNTPVAAALFEINQEIEQTCLNNAQRELEQMSGADFDRCYIFMQVGLHSQLASVLSVLKSRVTSPEFKKAIEETSQVVDQHLDHAKKIAKQLEQQTANNAHSTTR
jgi:putative membrane protein